MAFDIGIWTKHLKAKTELHQTVITRCLKSLESKQLIKVVKSVKHPTRKIYMMAHLEPSVEITGGPWYTDNELDIEFIRMLSSACLQYIRDRTLPKGSLGAPPSERKLFPHSNHPPYPNAAQILSFLQKSRITDTQLGLEHVEMLLNVLVYDGLIERLPAFGGGLFGDALGKSDEESSDEEELSFKKRSRKNKSKHNDEEDSPDEEKKRSKKKRRRQSPSSEVESSPQPKKKSKKRNRHSSDEESDSETDRRKHKKKKRKQQDSDADSSEDDRPARKKKNKSKKEPEETFTLTELTEGTAVVYRALFETQSTVGLGWTESPCAKCPQFEFCDGGTGLSTKGAMDLEEGPVNPRNCVYFEAWTDQSVVVT